MSVIPSKLSQKRLAICVDKIQLRHHSTFELLTTIRNSIVWILNCFSLKCLRLSDSNMSLSIYSWNNPQVGALSCSIVHLNVQFVYINALFLLSVHQFVTPTDFVCQKLKGKLQVVSIHGFYPWAHSMATCQWSVCG